MDIQTYKPTLKDKLFGWLWRSHKEELLTEIYQLRNIYRNILIDINIERNATNTIQGVQKSGLIQIECRAIKRFDSYEKEINLEIMSSCAAGYLQAYANNASIKIDGEKYYINSVSGSGTLHDDSVLGNKLNSGIFEDRPLFLTLSLYRKNYHV